ncbi:MAG TPA: hypothetical protein VGQ65_11475 [Thermoanaerobaculia bacterium]|nr:hypothetical protein [Thermoanaerobaculia bacterium]
MSDQQKLRDMFDEIVPLLDQVRIMYRFMDLVGDYKECIPIQAQLWGEFSDILNDEFAPHAWRLAAFIVELLETRPDAFPYGAFETKSAAGQSRSETPREAVKE